MVRFRTITVSCLLAVAAAGSLLAGRGASLPPNVVLSDLDGRPARLEAFSAGKVTILVFWATCCLGARRELTDLNELYASSSRTALEVVAINTETTRDLSDVKPFVISRKLAFPVLLDTEATLSKVLNPRGTRPFTVILDRKGAIAFEKTGYKSGDMKVLESEIGKLLAETPGQGD